MGKTAAERQHLIETRRRATNHTHRLYIRDRWLDLPVVLVPVEALLLNPDNRRFRAERLWAEEQLGRALDPENNPEDERSIESLLLDGQHRVDSGQIVGSPSADYEALRTDWGVRGQESPLWIRPDGTVRNGNRRLAMVKRLQREQGDTGLQWLEVVILDPETVDEPTLLEMEQREQLTENFKVRYSDIDYLLALREAAEIREIDWYDPQSIEEVAGTLQGMVEKTRSEVVRDLYAIKYMDAFLEDSDQAGQYHKLLRTLERFRDIGRMMMQVEQDYPDDATEVLQVLFAAVRAGVTHGDIRKLRQMFRKDRGKFDQLAAQLSAIHEEAGINGGAPPLAAPVAVDSTDQDEGEGDEEGPGPEVLNYPRREVASLFQVSIDGFEAGQQRNLLQTLREVENRLTAISGGGRLEEILEESGSDAEAIRSSLSGIIGWVDSIRGLLE